MSSDLRSLFYVNFKRGRCMDIKRMLEATEAFGPAEGTETPVMGPGRDW